MPASIRRVGDDVSVSVSPERLVKKAERTEAEMASIHRALRELEEAVAEGEPFSYADEVDAQSAEIAECQQSSPADNEPVPPLQSFESRSSPSFQCISLHC